VGAQFAATSWTTGWPHKQGGSPEAAAALEKLCRPTGSALRLTSGAKVTILIRAQDLTQEFFTASIKENYLGPWTDAGASSVPSCWPR